MPSIHDWDAGTDLFAHSVIGYAIERVKTAKDPRWGAAPADELEAALDGIISPDGVGAHQALAVFRDVLMPATRPMDDPMNLAYVPTAPSNAATMFDLVVSASAVFGGNWESGAGAIAAENQALRWLADLAGYPDGAGGCFVSGGSAANLSALVTARSEHRKRQALGQDASPGQRNSGAGPTRRLAIAATKEAHASVRATANVMDVDVVSVVIDGADRMTGPALKAALDAIGPDGPEVFAVAATGGTTNSGAVDDLNGLADVCEQRKLWLHVDGAYGLAALAAPSARHAFAGIARSHSFGVDPHKWLFAPYDCAALVYRDPTVAAEAHAQHGDYLDAIDRNEHNPSDYAYHLSRRARGLPLWFSLATYGTDAYAEALDKCLAAARGFALAVSRSDHCDLLLEPQLSVVLFTRKGWSETDYAEWSDRHARKGDFLVVPTKWHDEPCLRVCVVNPRTTAEMLNQVLDSLA